MINLNKKNQKFLITGGTGFIGSRLIGEILEDAHEVTVLTRNQKLLKEKNKVKYINNLEEKFNYDIVINLCGEPISQRWTKNKKEEIYHSRIDITKKLAEIIKNSKTPPSLVISGSAVGYYGISENQILDEETKPANQNLFSQNLCRSWENYALPISNKSRLVIIRTGVVIGKNGGIIKKMLTPFKFGLGGKIGSGEQYLSWIFLDDVIGAINHIINNDNLSGPINLTSPKAVTNKIFSKALAKLLNRPCIFKMPSFLVKIIFGQMANELLLSGQNVIPKKLLQSGYIFKVKNIEDALKNST